MDCDTRHDKFVTLSPTSLLAGHDIAVGPDQTAALGTVSQESSILFVVFSLASGSCEVELVRISSPHVFWLGCGILDAIHDQASPNSLTVTAALRLHSVGVEHPLKCSSIQPALKYITLSGRRFHEWVGESC